MPKSKTGERQAQLENRPYLAQETEGAMPGGRAGGKLQRNIATRDEHKRAFERPAGKTRVRKKDQRK